MATYSFLNIKAAISGPGGAFAIGGSAEGAAEEGIDVNFTDDKNTLTIGAGGQAMHSLHAGKAGEIVVRLLQTSAVNAQLSQLFALQTADSNLHGQNTITIRDTARGDVHTGRLSAFKKHADAGYKKDGGVREWRFDVGSLDMQFGAGVPDVNV